ncbi:MAG: FGGY-family carbohydrate kinase, partial [Pararhizobium sp.]
LSGNVVAVGRSGLAQLCPQPNHIERDMDAAWAAAAKAIREAIAAAGIAPQAIAGVGVTGHGDGLYCLDSKRQPLGHGMMSLDSRAAGVVAAWGKAGILERALPLVGQHPYPYSAPSLLAWMKRHEPERYRRVRHVFFCKDWLRFCLTGEIAIDLTEASTGFTDLDRQDYSGEALALYGLEEIAPALPPILESDSPAGTVTAEAARATGLIEGTPVAAGLHDVTAAAVGMGNLDPGDLTITAGTFSINEVLSDRPAIDRNPHGPRWSCRSGVRRGTWMNMSISPASSSNLEWVVKQLGEDNPAALLSGMETELDRAAASPASVIYHPFLYGSPHGSPDSAAFFGLKAWHGRAEMLQAVLEGIVFNHRTHVDALAGAFDVKRVRLTGGGSGHARMAQLFADGLGRPIEVPAQSEAAALGAALCAGVAVGAFADLSAAAEACCRIAAAYEPAPGRAAVLDRKFDLYTRLVAALQPFWQELDAPAESGDQH